MVMLAIRHWFSLLWERPTQVLFVNITVLLILGIGFGVVGLLPIHGNVYLAFTLGSTMVFLVFWGGLQANAAEVSEGKTWAYSRVWKLTGKGLGGMFSSLAWALVALLIWKVSIPAYLQAPDFFPPENPVPVSVIFEGDRPRLSWMDPLDADLAGVIVEWGVPHEEGWVDPGLGSLLLPVLEKEMKVFLRAVDFSGRRSEGLEILIGAEDWSVTDIPEGVRGRPSLQVSGVGTDGFNLDWGTTEQGETLSRASRFRVMTADTRDGLPGASLEIPGASRVIMGWTESVTRRAFRGIGWGNSGWYQVQALWDDGSFFASDPLFVATLGAGNLVVGGILVVVLVWVLLSFPFWLPWKNQTGKGWWKSLYESQTYAARNLGFLLGSGVAALAWLLVSAFLLTSFPGIFGLSLWYEEALRMRRKADTWLEENPEADPRRPPWNLIFAEEKEKMKSRGIRNLFTPWR